MSVNNSHTVRGFVALMATVIISAVLLILLFTLGVSSFFSRFDALDTESKHESLAHAESCVSSAMLKLTQAQTYTGNEYCDLTGACSTSMSASQRVCNICSVTAGAGSSKIILARAANRTSYTTLQVTFDPTLATPAVTKWVELKTSPDVTCLVP